MHGVVVGEIGCEVHGAGIRLGLGESYWSSGFGWKGGSVDRFHTSIRSIPVFFDLQRFDMKFAGGLTLTAYDFVHLLHAFY
jgi:hypothetical protein